MALPVSPNFGLNPAKWPHPDSNISSSIWASDGTTSHGASCVSARFNLLNLLVTEKSTLDGSAAVEATHPTNHERDVANGVQKVVNPGLDLKWRAGAL